MTEYLCNEPIIAVYEGVQELAFADFFLDYCNELAFHVTPGARLILETEGVIRSCREGDREYDLSNINLL